MASTSLQWVFRGDRSVQLGRWRLFQRAPVNEAGAAVGQALSRTQALGVALLGGRKELGAAFYGRDPTRHGPPF
jgi:hypothetical protein